MPDEREESAPRTDFIREIIREDLRTGRFTGPVHTRFPPEPNGYLHIGHAKAICLNFAIAEEFGGLCNLRFDDTNPTKEEREYVEAIKEDIRWLGFDWADREFYASDYFDQLYQWAVQLIQAGRAYVDDLSAEEIRQYRGTLTEPGRESPYRNRPVEENLDLGVSLPSATPWQPGSDHLSIVYEYLSFLLDRGGEPVSMVDQAVAIPVPATLFGSGMLVPASLQKQEDHVRLAAELAYGLVLSRPGSGLVAHLPSKKGKDLVTAIMLTLAPKLKVPDPQGTIRALADKLKQAPAEVRSDLRTILAGLTKRKAALSISRYYRAVRSTAARTALLVTGDLGPVIRVLVSLGAQEAILDLLTFALSEAHLQMRRDLGISLVV